MSRLRDLRAYAHPLLLIAVWSSLEAATIAWSALLPGNPSGGSFAETIVLTAILVFFVALGSRVAWWLAIFSSTVSLCIGVGLGLFEFAVKPWGFAAFQAAALWLLWSGNIELYVQSRKRMRRLADPRPAR